jgi:hypothetical protein
MRSINSRTLICDRHAVQIPCRVIAHGHLVDRSVIGAGLTLPSDRPVNLAGDFRESNKNVAGIQNVF